LTVTVVTVPVNPETVTLDGYGAATPEVPEPGIAIAEVLVTVVQAVGERRADDSSTNSPFVRLFDGGWPLLAKIRLSNSDG
jgi:hypothetical protein